MNREPAETPPEQEAGCAYADIEYGYKCKRPQWEHSAKGYCKCHAEENSRSEESAREVWRIARQKVKEGDCDFSGWQLPEDPDHVGFWEKGTLDEERQFTGKADFTCATFTGAANFNDATFTGDADFGDATFKGFARFTRATFTGGAFFRAATFKRHAFLRRATFTGETYFRGATFAGDADFYGAKPGHSLIMDFPTWRWPWQISRPFRLPEAGEEAYRLAKQSAANRGEYSVAGDYYYAERSAALCGKRREYGWKLWRWLPEYALSLIFGYGERPLRPLVTGLLVVLVWAGLYYANAAIVPTTCEPDISGPTFRQCLYFSGVTFTTLGYGDYRPAEAFDLLAMAEAGLGAALMALFIVSLARRYGR